MIAIITIRMARANANDVPCASLLTPLPFLIRQKQMAFMHKSYNSSDNGMWDRFSRRIAFHRKANLV